MPSPWGYEHRHEPGPRGRLARWWLRHRVSRVRLARARIR